MNEIFRAEHGQENGTAIVRFIGELDTFHASHAEEAGISALSGVNGDGLALVIDVSGLVFCDSTGLRALLRIRDEAATTGHRLTLRRPSEILRRMLEITDLRKQFSIDD